MGLMILLKNVISSFDSYPVFTVAEFADWTAIK